MLVLLFTAVLGSITLPMTNAALNCSICQMGNYFVESNGYGCFQLQDDSIACTCPDQRYSLNKPCRICDRSNICGNTPGSICAESMPSSLGVQTNETHYFACFCSDMSFLIGKPCPPVPTVQPPITAPIQ